MRAQYRGIRGTSEEGEHDLSLFALGRRLKKSQQLHVCSFAGFKLFNFQLPPNHSRLVEFSLLPILTGPVQLPPLRLTCLTTDKELLDAQAIHRVFVIPAEVIIA